jgi:hypothetical protein
VTALQVAKAECANSDMSGEEYLARKYCEPKAYWHCTHELGGSSYYTFAEINCPQNRLKVVAEYTQQESSAAAKQLHRRVEAARAAFRATQEQIYGHRTLYAISRHRECIEKQELSAWNTFNAQKQNYRKGYLHSIKSRIVRRIRGKKCIGCGAAIVLGRAKCPTCIKQRNRESTRQSKARKRALKVDFSVLQPHYSQ